MRLSCPVSPTLLYLLFFPQPPFPQKGGNWNEKGPSLTAGKKYGSNRKKSLQISLMHASEINPSQSNEQSTVVVVNAPPHKPRTHTHFPVHRIDRNSDRRNFPTTTHACRNAISTGSDKCRINYKQSRASWTGRKRGTEALVLLRQVPERSPGWSLAKSSQVRFAERRWTTTTTVGWNSSQFMCDLLSVRVVECGGWSLHVCMATTWQQQWNPFAKLDFDDGLLANGGGFNSERN